MSCLNTLQWQWRLCVKFGAVLVMDEQEVRLYCRVLEFEGIVVGV